MFTLITRFGISFLIFITMGCSYQEAVKNNASVGNVELKGKISWSLYTAEKDCTKFLQASSPVGKRRAGEIVLNREFAVANSELQSAAGILHGRLVANQVSNIDFHLVETMAILFCSAHEGESVISAISIYDELFSHDPSIKEYLEVLDGELSIEAVKTDLFYYRKDKMYESPLEITCGSYLGSMLQWMVGDHDSQGRPIKRQYSPGNNDYIYIKEYILGYVTGLHIAMSGPQGITYFSLDDSFGSPVVLDQEASKFLDTLASGCKDHSDRKIQDVVHWALREYRG